MTWPSFVLFSPTLTWYAVPSPCANSWRLMRMLWRFRSQCSPMRYLWWTSLKWCLPSLLMSLFSFTPRTNPSKRAWWGCNMGRLPSSVNQLHTKEACCVLFCFSVTMLLNNTYQTDYTWEHKHMALECRTAGSPLRFQVANWTSEIYWASSWAAVHWHSLTEGNGATPTDVGWNTVPVSI